MDSARLLERCLAAEEERDQALDRIAELQLRMKAIVNSDPVTASQALSWIGRAENAEKLLREIVNAVKGGKLGAADFPAGWYTRIESQLASVSILERDNKVLGERPPEDTKWETFETKGRRWVGRG